MEPTDVASVYVSVDGPEGARLEERSSSGEDPWRVVCALPREARVVPAPAAKHRVVDEERGARGVEDVRIARGDVRVVYSRGHTAAKIVTRVAGIAVVVVGGRAFGIGVLGMLLGACADSSCGEAREAGAIYLIAGGAVAAIGAAFLVWSGDLGRPSVSVRSQADRSESAVRRPETPALPRAYATLFSVRF